MQKVSQQMGIDKVSLVKVLDFLPYPFLVSEFRDSAQHNIFVNKKFMDEIGYTCEDIPTINDWFRVAYPNEIYRSEIIADWNHRITAAKEGGEDSVVTKAKIQTKRHGLKWYEVKASVYGEINFVAFVNIDAEITRELELKRLNENKDRTLSILSHDLRTPLSNLYSVLLLLNNGQLTENETQLALGNLTGQVFKMLEFLETTLQWSKTNFGELRPKPQQIDIGHIVKSILDIYQVSYAEKHIAVMTALDTYIPLRCDPEIFSILFRNILSNAVKYTPEGGTIIISNELRGNKYVFSVQNSGRGISQEKIQMILSKNYQSEPGTMGEKGLGLGLKFCQQLLEHIHGNLEIESNHSYSTVFRILLQP